MRHEIQLVGQGGQGIRLAGAILARAFGIYDKKNIVETHLYGAAARGGLSESELVVSDEEIYYVKVQNPDVLIALSQRAYDDFSEPVKNSGVILADDFYVKNFKGNDKRLTLYPLTRIALDTTGSLIAVNVVSLGLISALYSVINVESMRKAIRDLIREKHLSKNLEAFEEGYKLGDNR